MLKFVEKVKDDNQMRMKFNQKVDAIKTAKREITSDANRNAIMHPDLEFLESAYFPERYLDGDEGTEMEGS